MSLWYSIIDFLFPFEWVQYDFMKNALLGVLLVTPMFGILGTMVVNNKMAFFSDALGHSALTGIAIRKFIGNKQFEYRNDNICNRLCIAFKLCKK